MKIAIHIFALYMLCLTLIPCGDGGGGLVEIANHLFNIEHQHDSDHEQHSNNCDDDHCSPFCICNCCSVTVDFPQSLAMNVQSPAPSPDTAPSCYSDLILSTFASDFWQPPRTS